MATKNSKIARRLKIRRRIRTQIRGTADRLRLAVYRSNKAIYTQLIDDEKGHTLIACSSRSLTPQEDSRIDNARRVGAALAEQAIARGIHKIVFDRSGYLYHGQVKALAEGAREKGLQF